jgi:hypothetical protein
MAHVYAEREAADELARLRAERDELRGLVREARLLQAPGATAQARPAVARQAVA